MNSAKFQDTKVISVFQSTNNKPLEREIKNKISFTITAKRIKYVGINLIKTSARFVHRKLQNIKRN